MHQHMCHPIRLCNFSTFVPLLYINFPSYLHIFNSAITRGINRRKLPARVLYGHFRYLLRFLIEIVKNLDNSDYFELIIPLPIFYMTYLSLKGMPEVVLWPFRTCFAAAVHELFGCCL